MEFRNQLEAVLQEKNPAVHEITKLHASLDIQKNKVCCFKTPVLLQVHKTIVFEH
jgi:hypothetical protein